MGMPVGRIVLSLQAAFVSPIGPNRSLNTSQSRGIFPGVGWRRLLYGRQAPGTTPLATSHAKGRMDSWPNPEIETGREDRYLKVWHESIRSCRPRLALGWPSPGTGSLPPILVPALLILAATYSSCSNRRRPSFFLQVALVVVAIALGRSALLCKLTADTMVLVGTTPIAAVAASLLARSPGAERD